jgi:hypothetical protein
MLNLVPLCLVVAIGYPFGSFLVNPSPCLVYSFAGLLDCAGLYFGGGALCSCDGLVLCFAGKLKFSVGLLP